MTISKNIVEEIREKIENTYQPLGVLLEVYQRLFDYDNKEKLDPTKCHISSDLATELMGLEKELMKQYDKEVDSSAVLFEWVNKGPSFKNDLAKFEIREEVDYENS